MNNKLIDNAVFLKEFIEFNNIEDDNKKYEKGLKLINDIEKVKEPNERDELIFYSYIAELFYYMARIGVRIDIWTHFMRGCIIDYVH